MDLIGQQKHVITLMHYAHLLSCAHLYAVHGLSNFLYSHASTLQVW